MDNNRLFIVLNIYSKLGIIFDISMSGAVDMQLLTELDHILLKRLETFKHKSASESQKCKKIVCNHHLFYKNRLLRPIFVCIFPSRCISEPPGTEK